MINKISSTSTLLFYGLSSMANTSVSVSDDLPTEEKLYAEEYIHNAPQNSQSKSDMYIENTYRVDFEELPYGDSNLLELTQKIAEDQVVLDADFVNALDELLHATINSAPTKSRF